MEKQKQQPQRLQSLDALRGFDMLFIMGGASLFVALATLFLNPSARLSPEKKDSETMSPKRQIKKHRP